MRVIRRLPALAALLLATQLVALCQSSPTRIPGVVEPPELTGEPKKLKKITETQRQFGKIVEEFKDKEKTKETLPALDKFIAEHPEYSDAYFIRANCHLCILDSHEYSSILKDFDVAISTHSLPTSETLFDNLTDAYSLRGKIKFVMGRYREAMDDLELSMKQDLSSADKIFNSEGIVPENTSKPCAWNLSDLNTLSAQFPKDYRAFLFRGLYFKFFTTFKEDYYRDALREFQRAGEVNSQSSLPPYFIGELYTKASSWTKAAWSTDEGREEPLRKAVQAFTNAIRLDPKFRPAYEERASAYESLKEYQPAIKDYNRVLELDPENVTAYDDRGLAELESGQYFAAIVDYGEGSRRMKEGASYLGTAYESRADAYVKVGDYRRAIADYSKAIERRLANDTFLLSLKQIRGLYPEYDNVSDEAFCKKINALFWPEFDYSVIEQKLLRENGKWEISLLNDLYEKRGDAYLQANDFDRGALDFKRIFIGIPNFAGTVDRWRLLGTNGSGVQYYLDVKSVESAKNTPARLWLKTIKKKTYTVESYEINCQTRRINETATVVYDSNGQVIESSESPSGWQRIIPDTTGERLFQGLCSNMN